MIRLALAGLLVPVLAFGQARRAADPDWPCQQIKVPSLSLAAVWAGPAIDTDDTGWQDDPEISEEVRMLAPRRLPAEQAQTLIDDFANRAGDRKQIELPRLLAGLLSALDQERGSVMAGLDRFGARQKELAAEIRGDNERLRTLQADTSADPKAVAEMTRQVNWEAEVFQDRRQALSYACEVPAKIEQRLFMLAEQIKQQMD